ELGGSRHRDAFGEAKTKRSLDQSRPEHLVELLLTTTAVAKGQHFVYQWLGPGVRQPQTVATDRLCGVCCGQRLQQRRNFLDRNTRRELDRADVAAVHPLAELPEVGRQRLDRGAI